jgi:hypothetical protein
MKRILLNPVLKSPKAEPITRSQGRYPTRSRQPPSRLAYIANETANICHGVIPTQSHEKRCRIAVEDLDSPTLKQALKSSSKEQRAEAISEEFQSLQEADTWDIVFTHLLESVFSLPNLCLRSSAIRTEP